MFACALPTELLSFLFPFMICRETSRATAFDLYYGISIIWIKHFLEYQYFASFHCFTIHFPKPLHG